MMRWLLIFWMFVVSAVAFLDRVNIAVAATTIAHEFHLSNMQLGAVMSAFLWGYALFQAPGGALADRLGSRMTLSVGVVWWGIFTCLITFLSPGLVFLLPLLLLVRFSLGVGEAVVYPTSNRVVAEWIPSRERGVANGFIFAGVGFGSAFASPFVTELMLRYGWRPAFWVSAVLGLIAGAIWFVIARDRPENHPWVSRQELAHIQSGLPETGSRKVKQSWRAIFTNRPLQLITASYFSFVWVAYIFFSWFFAYLSQVRGLDLKSTSYYGMLPLLAMSIGSPLGGWISDVVTRRHGKRVGRCLVAAAAMLLCGVFIGLGPFVANARVASVVLAGGAGALYLSQSCFWSMSADIGQRSAGAVSGIMNMGGQIGGGLVTVAMPAIAQAFGWTPSFLVAAGLAVLGALAWLFVKPSSELEFAESPRSVPDRPEAYPGSHAASR